MYTKYKKGLSFIEVLLVIGVMALIAVIALSTFISFRKHSALAMDTDTVIGLLRQARNQTLSSKNSSAYGVHFTAPSVTLFTGSAYSAGAADNQTFVLSSTDTILTISLTGGGSDVVFQRLTGETGQNGTIVLSAPGIPETKTVTIYKTGLVEMQ